MNLQDEIKKLLQAVDAQRMTPGEAQKEIDKLYRDYYARHALPDTDLLKTIVC